MWRKGKLLIEMYIGAVYGCYTHISPRYNCKILWKNLNGCFMLNKKWKFAILSMGGLGGHYAKWNNSDRRDTGYNLYEKSKKCNKAFPESSVGKEPTCNAGDPSLIPGLGRSAGEEIGYPLQYSGLEIKSMGSQRVGHDWITFTSFYFQNLLFLGTLIIGFE